MEATVTMNKQVMLMLFGLPVLTTGIVIVSMYAGYQLTLIERPTQFTVTAAPPKIDVNVPTMPAPQIQVTTPQPQVSIQVPPTAPPTVNVTTPPAAVTVNTPPASVTVIDKRDDTKSIANAEKPVSTVGATVDSMLATVASLAQNSAPAATATIAVTAPAATPPQKHVPEIKAAPIMAETKAAPASRGSFSEPKEDRKGPVSFYNVKPVSTSASVSVQTPSHPMDTVLPKAELVKLASGPADLTHAVSIKSTNATPILTGSDEPTLDTLYACATEYIEMYCRKHGLDVNAENHKWEKHWRAGLDQAISDNIDSSEQSYINRMVISKRDYFNIEKSSPEKIVEACRLLLRYRDGQLAWLQAMKDAMTKENLRKTVAFLSAGPAGN